MSHCLSMHQADSSWSIKRPIGLERLPPTVRLPLLIELSVFSTIAATIYIVQNVNTHPDSDVKHRKKSSAHYVVQPFWRLHRLSSRKLSFPRDAGKSMSLTMSRPLRTQRVHNCRYLLEVLRSTSSAWAFTATSDSQEINN